MAVMNQQEGKQPKQKLRKEVHKMGRLEIKQHFELNTTFVPNPGVKKIAKAFGDGEQTKVRGYDKRFSELVIVAPARKQRRLARIGSDGHISLTERLRNIDRHILGDQIVRTWKTLRAIALSQEADIANGNEVITFMGDKDLVTCAYRLMTNDASFYDGLVQGSVPNSHLGIMDESYGSEPKQVRGNLYHANKPMEFQGDFTSREFAKMFRKRA